MISVLRDERFLHQLEDGLDDFGEAVHGRQVEDVRPVQVDRLEGGEGAAEAAVPVPRVQPLQELQGEKRAKYLTIDKKLFGCKPRRYPKKNNLAHLKALSYFGAFQDTSSQTHVLLPALLAGLGHLQQDAGREISDFGHFAI